MKTALGNQGWLAVLLAAVLLVGASPANGPVLSAGTGIVNVVGTNGIRQQASPPVTLQSGDTVETAPNSTAVVQVPTLGKLLLGPSTSVQNEMGGSTPSLALQSGMVCAQADAPGLTINAGTVSLSSQAMATIVDVARNPGTVQLAVYGGSVSANSQGTSTSLPVGQAANVDAHGTLRAANISQVSNGFSALNCPDGYTVSRVIAQANNNFPVPSYGWHGVLTVLAAIAGIALIASSHGSGGGSSPTTQPTFLPSGSPTSPGSPNPTPSATSTSTPTPAPTPTPTASPSPAATHHH